MQSPLAATIPQSANDDNSNGGGGSPSEQQRDNSTVLFELRHTKDPSLSRSFDPSRQVAIGRDAAACDIVFPTDAGTISRIHCKVFSLGRDVLVADWSSNGTFINSRVLGKGCTRRIQSGDTLSLTHPGLPNADNFKWLFHSSCEMQDAKREQDRLAAASAAAGSDDPMQQLRDGAAANDNLLEQHYEMREILGSGNFGICKRAISRDKDRRQVAVKIVEKKRFAMNSSDFSYDALLNEADIMRKMQHENIVRVFDVYDDSEKFAMVLELVRGGDLFDYIVGRGVNPFSEADARLLFVQMLQAQLYMNSRKISHRDLKPENVLVAVDPEFHASLPPGASAQANAPRIPVSRVTLKITDFGLAKFCQDNQVMKTMCGTPTYLAPEVMSQANNAGGGGAARESAGYGPEVDIWSLGCILYILLSGTMPKGAHQGLQFSKYFNQTSSHALDLITRMLERDPKRRATLEDICAHQWLRGVTIKGREWAMPPPEEERLAATVTVTASALLQANSSIGGSQQQQGPTTATGTIISNVQVEEREQSPKHVLKSSQQQQQQHSQQQKSPINIPTRPKDMGEEALTDQDESDDEEDTAAAAAAAAAAGTRRQRDGEGARTAGGGAGNNGERKETFQRPDDIKSIPQSQPQSQQQEGAAANNTNNGANALTPQSTVGAPTPVPEMRRVVEWRWKRDLDKRDDDGSAWQAYGPVDSAHVERAYQKQNIRTVKLKSNDEYRISFEGMFQYRQDDTSKQRPVKRAEVLL